MSDLPPPPPPPPPGAYGGGPAGYGATPPLAELGPRVVAFIVDWIAIPFGAYLAIFIVGIVLGVLSDALAALFLVAGYFGMIGFFGYQLYLEGTTGQTVGKKMQGIQLVGLENGGRPIGFGMAFLRHFINGLVCNLGWLFPFFDAQRQTLGDKVSKSVVVPAAR